MKTTQIVKGMTNMRPTADVSKFVRDLVSHYASYDKMSGGYSVHINDIPEFDLQELAALLISKDDSCASEATSFDNPAYEKTMLPALMRYLKNSTDRDEEIEFNKAWRDGVTSYFYKTIQELLNEECNNKLHDEYSEVGLYPRTHRDNGEIYWSRQA